MLTSIYRKIPFIRRVLYMEQGSRFGFSCVKLEVEYYPRSKGASYNRGRYKRGFMVALVTLFDKTNTVGIISVSPASDHAMQRQAQATCAHPQHLTLDDL